MVMSLFDVNDGLLDDCKPSNKWNDLKVVKDEKKENEGGETEGKKKKKWRLRVVPGAAIRLGHIPYGFFEQELLDYFSQFGKVHRVRVPRSKKTGNHKGWAYVLFNDRRVAKIAAEAMDNYLMYNSRISCRQVDRDKMPNCLKKGPTIYQRPKRFGQAIIEARRLNALRSSVECQRRQAAVMVSNLLARNARLARLGIDYRLPVPSLPESLALSAEQWTAISDEDDRRRKMKNAKLEHKSEVKEEEEKEEEEGDITYGSLEGDTTVGSKFSMLVDSEDPEIEFRTPPFSVRKSFNKRLRQHRFKTQSPTQ